MNLGNLYDPVDQAPVAKFDKPGDTLSGVIVKSEWQHDKYGSEQIPAITLRLDKPTADGDEHAVIFARSKQMQREIGKKAQRAGATDEEIGNWLSVTYVEDRECSNGEMKWYAAEYKLANPSDEDGPLGRGLLGDSDTGDEPDF